MTQTERVVHDFVRNAVSRLSEALSVVPAKFEYVTRWERGTDRHFRERESRRRQLSPTLNNEWLALLPEYTLCVESLKSNAVIGRHLDRAVGTNNSRPRFPYNARASLV